MSSSSGISYQRILQLAFIVGVGLFIWAFLNGLYVDARGRGLPEPFQWVFAAAGFIIFVLVLPKLLKRGE